MRAKIGKRDGTWVAELWMTGINGVPFFFGSRKFPTWEEALRWGIWRLKRRG